MSTFSLEDPLTLLSLVCLPQNERKLGLFVCACWNGSSVLSAGMRDEVSSISRNIDQTTLNQANQWRNRLIEMELELSEQIWNMETGEFTTQWNEDLATLASILLPGTQALNYWDWGPLEAEITKAAEHARNSNAVAEAAWIRDRGRQYALLQDIFGAPDRVPVVSTPLPRRPDVHAIATAIYQTDSFCELSILADALSDAGCHDELLLQHCRQEHFHVRGCWALDELLGKDVVEWTRGKSS